jgi:hypothetical protein
MYSVPLILYLLYAIIFLGIAIIVCQFTKFEEFSEKMCWWDCFKYKVDTSKVKKTQYGYGLES